MLMRTLCNHEIHKKCMHYANVNASPFLRPLGREVRDRFFFWNQQTSSQKQTKSVNEKHNHRRKDTRHKNTKYNIKINWALRLPSFITKSFKIEKCFFAFFTFASYKDLEQQTFFSEEIYIYCITSMKVNVFDGK